MLNVLLQRVARLATWPTVALLFVLFLLCSQGFEIRRKSLGYENPALDSRFRYSPEEARDFFAAIGERGRLLYAVTEVTLDLVFPFVYGTLFAALLLHVYPRKLAAPLVLLSLVTAAADLAENVSLASLAWQFDGRASPLIRGVALLTAGKFLLLGGLVLLLLVGAGFRIVYPAKPPADEGAPG